MTHFCDALSSALLVKKNMKIKGTKGAEKHYECIIMPLGELNVYGRRRRFKFQKKKI